MKKLLSVLAGNAQATPPVWLMRQAGRYLPEYRETRKKAGSFLDLCYTPELAEEVTLQPIRRYGFDAAILFADILLVPHAMGMQLEFIEGTGPVMAWPNGDDRALRALKPVDALDETVAPVYETVARLSKSLPAETTLIGFAGAPWTVATYMAAGRGTPDQAPARRWILEDPAGFDMLIERITTATIHYLSRQVDAGAEVVMLFDSWAGSLTPPQAERYVIGPASTIVTALRERHPALPIIGFPKGATAMIAPFAATTGVNAVALDHHVPLDWAKVAVGGRPVMGNLDPLYMVVGGDALVGETRRILEAMRGHPHIFNLGHGITPDADPRHVDLLLETIRA